MKKMIIAAAVSLASLSLGQLSAIEQKIGIANFNSFITDSKLGKQEQSFLETMNKQFMTLLEDTDKQLKEINGKLEDKDHLDGLSPEAEQELRAKFAQLNEEMGRYNQQYMQFRNQGQYKVFQTILTAANQAAEKVAASKGFTQIANKEMFFYFSPTLDVTADVLKEMDKNYDEEAKKQTPPAEENKPTAVTEETKDAAAQPAEAR